MPSLPTPISANPALLGDPGFGTAATHMLIKLPPTIALADAVQDIKASSSKWMGKRFAWQRGYGAFSVCKSTLEAVARYIRNQEAHHRKMNYEQEFIALLEKHGVAYDPEDVFR